MAGFYIRHLPDGTPLPAIGKADELRRHIAGAKTIKSPTEWQEDLVCVVVNGPYDTVAYMYSIDELEQFQEVHDATYVWLIVPGARKLSGYVKA